MYQLKKYSRPWLSCIFWVVLSAPISAEQGKFIRIEPGVFMMGSDNYAPDEKPVHKVNFDRAFEIMSHEVTLGAFRRFVAATGYKTDGPCRYYDGQSGAADDHYRHFTQPGFDRTDDHPVVCVSAIDASNYADWLTKKTGQRYRLPSEAEWEYVARAGSGDESMWKTPADACTFANISDLKRAYAHHDGRHYFAAPTMYGSADEHTFMCDDNAVFTAAVGSFKPNAWGAYDMIGNVWEWVADCANGSSNAVPVYSAAASDGKAVREKNCNRTVIRGGSWHTGPKYSHVTNRTSIPSGNRMYHLGFRLVREIPH